MTKIVYLLTWDLRFKDNPKSREIDRRGVELTAATATGLRDELSDGSVRIYYAWNNVTRQAAEVVQAILRPIESRVIGRDYPAGKDSIATIVEEASNGDIVVGFKWDVNGYLRNLGLAEAYVTRYYELKLPIK